jgi:hypothetical protein
VTAQNVSAGTALYVYGVTWADTARDKAGAGIGGADVSSVVSGDLAALTSPVRSTKVRARRRDLLTHSDVLAGALERGTVVPLQFGAVFENADAVVADFLEPRADELRGLLRELEGRVELRVTAFYGEEAILGEILRDNPRIARLREQTRSAPEAATYGLRIELGEAVAKELRARTQRDREGILARVRPLALAAQIDEEPVEHQVLRASFLVERTAVDRFDEAMNDVARQQDGRMLFKYLGPLPPHSFVSLDAGRG